MLNFSRNLTYGTWNLDVHFAKVHAPVGKFFVVVSDGPKEVVAFDMKHDEDKGWKVIQPAPDWIVRLEDQFSGFIGSALLV
jgi:hypothetical protein